MAIPVPKTNISVEYFDIVLLQAVLVFIVLNLPRIVLVGFEVDRIVKYKMCLVSEESTCMLSECID